MLCGNQCCAGGTSDGRRRGLYLRLSCLQGIAGVQGKIQLMERSKYSACVLKPPSLGWCVLRSLALSKGGWIQRTVKISITT